MDNILTTETPYGKFSYWPNDIIGKAIACGIFWDEHFKEEFDKLGPGSVAVDVGANLGWFSVYAAKRGCRVYAFEPCHEVLGLLRTNVEQNSVSPEVSIFPLALYEREQRLDAVDLGPENPADQHFDHGHMDTMTCKNSGALNLSPSESGVYWSMPMDAFHFGRLDLLKIDTEGTDLEVMKGGRETIETNHPVICYEYLGPNPDIDATRMNQFTAFMEEIGYVSEQVHMDMNGCYRDFIARPK